MAKVIPSKVSPFSKPFAKETLAVVPTLQIILVFNPVTKLSTYVLVAASEPALGEPNPVIVPPVIAILLDACVATEPRPKEVLAVAPDSATKLEPSPTIKLPSVFANPATSVRLATIFCLLFNCVWIAELTPLKYPNSVDVEELTATLPLHLIVFE